MCVYLLRYASTKCRKHYFSEYFFSHIFRFSLIHESLKSPALATEMKHMFSINSGMFCFFGVSWNKTIVLIVLRKLGTLWSCLENLKEYFGRLHILKKLPIDNDIQKPETNQNNAKKRLSQNIRNNSNCRGQFLLGLPHSR